MKIKCVKCQKKFKSIYMQCPHCGWIQGQSQTRPPLAVDQTRQYAMEPPKSIAPSRSHAPVRQEKKSGGIGKYMVWGMVSIILGVLLLQGGSYALSAYREEVNPKAFTVKKLQIGEGFDIYESYIAVKKAYVVEDGWINEYIPEGKKLLGVEVTGEERKEDDELPDVELYVSYGEGETVQYVPMLQDYKIKDYLEERGTSILSPYGYYSYDEKCLAIFLVDQEVTDFTLNYPQVKKSLLRGRYKGDLIQIDLVVK